MSGHCEDCGNTMCICSMETSRRSRFLEHIRPSGTVQVRNAVLQGYVFLVFGMGATYWNHWAAASFTAISVSLFIYDAWLDL